LLTVSDSLYGIKPQLNFILVVHMISQKQQFYLKPNVPHCEESHNKSKIKCNWQSKKCLKVLKIRNMVVIMIRIFVYYLF